MNKTIHVKCFRNSKLLLPHISCPQSLSGLCVLSKQNFIGAFMVKFPAFIWVKGYLSHYFPLLPQPGPSWTNQRLARSHLLWLCKKPRKLQVPRVGLPVRPHHPTTDGTPCPVTPILHTGLHSFGYTAGHVTSLHLIVCLSEQNSDGHYPNTGISFHVDLTTRARISGIWVRHSWFITYAIRKTSAQWTLSGGCRNSGQCWKPGKTGFCTTVFSKTQPEIENWSLQFPESSQKLSEVGYH